MLFSLEMLPVFPLPVFLNGGGDESMLAIMN